MIACNDVFSLFNMIDLLYVLFIKQRTAYVMRICDWSSDVCSSDLKELREAMNQLDTPSGMSIIARTAGIGRSVEELQWDLSYLLQLWTAIDGAARENRSAERSVGKECVCTCSSRCTPYHSKKKDRHKR